MTGMKYRLSCVFFSYLASHSCSLNLRQAQGAYHLQGDHLETSTSISPLPLWDLTATPSLFLGRSVFSSGLSCAVKVVLALSQYYFHGCCSFLAMLKPTQVLPATATENIPVASAESQSSPINTVSNARYVTSGYTLDVLG